MYFPERLGRRIGLEIRTLKTSTVGLHLFQRRCKVLQLFNNIRRTGFVQIFIHVGQGVIDFLQRLRIDLVQDIRDVPQTISDELDLERFRTCSEWFPICSQ